MRSDILAIRVGAQRLDPVALPWCLRPDGPRLLKCFPGHPEIVRCRRGGQRIAKQIDRNAPVGDGAVGVLLQDRFERLACLYEPVRMQHRHAALELRLHAGITGGREGDLPELVLLCQSRERHNAYDAHERQRHYSEHCEEALSYGHNRSPFLTHDLPSSAASGLWYRACLPWGLVRTRRVCTRRYW